MRSPRDLIFIAAQNIIKPLLPASKKLPFSYWAYRICGICGPDLSHLNEFIVSTRIALDIGANEGLFTYALSKRFERVYAFEVNDDVSGPIRDFNRGNIQLHSCALSSGSRKSKFYIPVVKGVAMAGWGSFNRENLEGAEVEIEREVDVKPLDDFEITGVDFIKIDVEGHEIEVLKGAARTIEHSRPIVLAEVKKENLHTVSTWFSALDYRHRSIDEIFNLPNESENHLYVPAEISGRLDHL